MKLLIFAAILLWLSAAVGGGVYLSHTNSLPASERGVYPRIFPPESRLERDASLPNLLFFAHPKCPCTRASLRELARLMADVDGRLKVHVIFLKPTGSSQDWAETDLRGLAEAIPNASVLVDEDEAETNLFDARTSGMALLYDRHGELRFNGGLTAARGHEGDNPGRRAVRAMITADERSNAEAPVFGCPLHSDACADKSGDHSH